MLTENLLYNKHVHVYYAHLDGSAEEKSGQMPDWTIARKLSIIA